MREVPLPYVSGYGLANWVTNPMPCHRACITLIGPQRRQDL